MTPVLVFFSLLGMAGWLPGLTRARRDWLGFRFLMAVFFIPLVLYVGNVILSIPLSAIVYLFVACSGVGLAANVFRNWKNRGETLNLALHPVWIFSILLFGVAVFRVGIDYLPYPGDEVASWLKISRQIYLADAYWSDRVIYHLAPIPTAGRSWLSFRTSLMAPIGMPTPLSCSFLCMSVCWGSSMT